MVSDRRARSRGVTMKLFWCRLSMIGKVFCLEFIGEGQPQCNVRARNTKGQKRTARGHYLVHIVRKEQNGWLRLSSHDTPM